MRDREKSDSPGGLVFQILSDQEIAERIEIIEKLELNSKPMIQPLRNQVLIERIEPPTLIELTDAPKSIKGVILSIGPRVTDVKVGDYVLFNSKWNDFSSGENKGTGADGSGPLERPLPIHADPRLHLVQEADIFLILSDPATRGSLKPGAEQQYMQNVEIKGPWNGGNRNEGEITIHHG